MRMNSEYCPISLVKGYQGVRMRDAVMHHIEMEETTLGNRIFTFDNAIQLTNPVHCTENVD